MMTISRRFFAAAAATTVATLASAGSAFANAGRRPQLADAIYTMRRATRFMTEKAAYRGGYVWAYLPDFSRRWGELEAKPTMIWVQPPGTATMGHAFLDAFYATGERTYYTAATNAADALLAGQLASGGWDYMADLAGETSTADWYDTIGRNAWRMEQFHHEYGNGTFDGGGTAEAAQLLMRLAADKADPKYRAALDRAIAFVVNSQYPMGGWPQRFPLGDAADYTSYVTFNDNVAGENIKLLVMCYRTFGDEALLAPIKRAMDAYVVTQQPKPQAGWGLQHTLVDLKPAAGRSFEPMALATHTTASNVAWLMNFFEMTGDQKYLARVAEALDWLDSVRLPAEQVHGGRTHPTFIEIGTNLPLYAHRFGSNVVNGSYFVNHDAEGAIVHADAAKAIDTDALRARLERLKGLSREDATRESPLNIRNTTLPRFFTLTGISVSDLNSNRGVSAARAPTEASVREVVAALNTAGYWPTELPAMTNPYSGPGASTPAEGDFSQTRVGDASDTSPYVGERPVLGVSARAFVENMAVLTQYVDNGEGPVQKRWFD